MFNVSGAVWLRWVNSPKICRNFQLVAISCCKHVCMLLSCTGLCIWFPYARDLDKTENTSECIILISVFLNSFLCHTHIASQHSICHLIHHFIQHENCMLAKTFVYFDKFCNCAVWYLHLRVKRISVFIHILYSNM